MRLNELIDEYKSNTCAKCGKEFKEDDCLEAFPSGVCEKCRKKSDSLDAVFNVQNESLTQKIENYDMNRKSIDELSGDYDTDIQEEEIEIEEESYGRPGRPRGKKDSKPRKKQPSWLKYTLFKNP